LATNENSFVILILEYAWNSLSNDVVKSPPVSILTRRPCCRRELPRDAGHLYRKLVPNPRTSSE